MAAYENEPDSITCRICDREVGAKGFPIHLRVHDKGYREYISENIEDFKKFGWNFCINCGTLTKSSGDKIPTCSMKCSSEYRKDYYSGGGNPRYGSKLKEETKRKIGEKAKERLSNPENHWNYGKKHSEETKRKISKAHKKLYENGYKNPMEGKTHPPEVIQKIFDSFTDSTLERKASELLDKNDYNYESQFFLTCKNGNVKSYDFRIKRDEAADILLEMDGDYWHGGPKYDNHFFKVEDVKENDLKKDQLAEDNGYEIVRIWKSEFEVDPYILIERIENA